MKKGMRMKGKKMMRGRKEGRMKDKMNKEH